MSNVSIYEKNWIDLVFEDKNKTYGAYQLRQENSKTTLFAFFTGIIFIFFLLSIGILLTSVDKIPTDVPLIPIDEAIVPVKIEQLQKVKPKQTKPNHPSPVEPKPKLSNMVVTTAPHAVDNVPKNDNSLTNQNTTPGVDTGINTPSTSSEGPAITPTAPTGGNDLVLSSTLDKLPEYPGGIKKFYEYVGNNFEKPDVDENASALSVIMSFVIEKDGSISSIKVLRSSDKNLETEAVRVLKSLKVKWSPGFKDGDKMRTLYTLPIKVAL